MTKKGFLFLFTVTLLVATSCKSRKNKCGTCPTWEKSTNEMPVEKTNERTR